MVLSGSKLLQNTDWQTSPERFLVNSSLDRRKTSWLDFLEQFLISQITPITGSDKFLGDGMSRAPYALTEKASTVEVSNLNYCGSNFPWIWLRTRTAITCSATSTEPPREASQTMRPKNVVLCTSLLVLRSKMTFFIIDRSFASPGKCHLHSRTSSKLQSCRTFLVGKNACATQEYSLERKYKECRRIQSEMPKMAANKGWEDQAFRNAAALWAYLTTKRLHLSRLCDAPTHERQRIQHQHLVRGPHDKTEIPVASRKTDSWKDTATAFFNNVFWLHGLPDNLMSDRDLKLACRFRKTLTDLCGIQLKILTCCPLQADGSKEIMKRMIGNYLRCFRASRQRDWDGLPTSTEAAYNSANVETFGMSPFNAGIDWNSRSPLDKLTRRRDLKTKVREISVKGWRRYWMTLPLRND